QLSLGKAAQQVDPNEVVLPGLGETLAGRQVEFRLGRALHLQAADCGQVAGPEVVRLKAQSRGEVVERRGRTLLLVAFIAQQEIIRRVVRLSSRGAVSLGGSAGRVTQPG